MKIENYIKNAEDLYFEKKIKQLEYEKTIIFKSRNATYSLEKVTEYNRKIRPRLISNEISSVRRKLDKKIAIFQIRTINPKFNIPSNVSTEKEIDRHLKLQYQQFNNYFDYMNNFKIKGNRLNKQYVRIYELTEALNIHSNSIDILQTKEYLKHYLKSVIFSKMKNNIGKTELIITEYTLKHLKRLFDNFRIRVKNKYKKLSLKQVGKYYFIEGIGCKLEEGIYFKLLTKEKGSKLELIKYFYKNILKERYTQKPTKEHLVFEKLKMRIKQFSKDFFNAKIEKHILYRTNNKLFLMVKNKKNKEIQLSPTEKDKKSFLYYTASLFRKSILFTFDKQFVFYSKNNNPSTKWVQIVDLKTYEKERYEEYSNNSDLQITKTKDKNLLYFYQELEVKKIFIKGKFIEEFEKNEFFDKDRISEIWKEYLMMLYYEKSKINIHKYMEELISDYYDKPSYKVAVYDIF